MMRRIVTACKLMAIGVYWLVIILVWPSQIY